MRLQDLAPCRPRPRPRPRRRRRRRRRRAIRELRISRWENDEPFEADRAPKGAIVATFGRFERSGGFTGRRNRKIP